MRGGADGGGALPRLLGIVAGADAAVAAGSLADRLRSSWAGPPGPPDGRAADGLGALVRKEMGGLADMGLVARDRDGRYAATPYGARAGASVLSPRSSVLARACLEAVAPAGLSGADLDMAVLATAGAAMAAQGMGLGAEGAARVPPEAERLRGILEGAGAADLAGWALGIAAVLHCWTGSVPVAGIVERCGK